MEWFAHPEAEQARLLAAIEAAQRGEQFGQLAAPAEEADQLREKRLEELQSIRREATSAKLTGAISQPVYQKAKFKISTGKKDLIEMPEQKRVEWVTRIVQAESRFIRMSLMPDIWNWQIAEPVPTIHARLGSTTGGKDGSVAYGLGKWQVFIRQCRAQARGA